MIYTHGVQALLFFSGLLCFEFSSRWLAFSWDSDDHHIMSKKSDSTTVNFEDSMEQLETLVTRMEQDGLSLEESLKTFEQGIHLTRVCQKALTDAEQEIKILMSDGEEEDFQTNHES